MTPTGRGRDLYDDSRCQLGVEHLARRALHDCNPPDGCILLAGGFAVGQQLALLRAALELSRRRVAGIQRNQTVVLVLVLSLSFQNFVRQQVEVVTEATELLAGGLAEHAEHAELAAELSEAAVAGLH
eukprot:scaffold85841_cov69-Phaeocystis_antarctica.AAC.2